MVSYSFKKCNYNDFSESNWHEILEAVRISSGLDDREFDRIAKNPVAKLLAALPFIAGADNSDQLAVLKVGMYAAGVRNPGMFSHRKNQTVRERLLPGVICPSGDTYVVELVTDFLELISINDHIHDYEADLENGHPNPVGEHILYYFSRREKLVWKIENEPDKELLEKLYKIINPIKCSYWDAGGGG